MQLIFSQSERPTMGDEWDDNYDLPEDPMDYVANVQSYSATAHCPKCGAQHGGSGKSPSAAQQNATSKAHACARKC